MSNQKKELTQRIEAKKKLLQAKLAQFKADTTGVVNDEQSNIQEQLKKVESALTEASDNFSDAFAKKINKWLK